MGAPLAREIVKRVRRGAAESGVITMAITWRDIIIISDAADLDDVEEEEADETADEDS